jgi:predicted transcriptional regulator
LASSEKKQEEGERKWGQKSLGGLEFHLYDLDVARQRAGSTVGSMATKTKSATNPEMTAEEIAAVKEGMADFAAGRVLTEEQFDEGMRRYFARREAQAGRRHARG